MPTTPKKGHRLGSGPSHQKAMLGNLVASLVDDGRLTRKVDGDDRRRTRLRLSAKGYRIYDEVAPLALQYQQRLLAELSGDDRALLEALLSKLSVENAA